MTQVDLVLFGHVHNYERTCSIYQNECIAMPTKDQNGVDTYDNRNYTAPVHAIIGMAGFTLDNFSNDVILIFYLLQENYLIYIYSYIQAWSSGLCLWFLTNQSNCMFTCMDRLTAGAFKGFLSLVI